MAEAEANLSIAPRSNDVAKDLAAGTIAGVAQLLVGHPFDTIKVVLQSQPAPAPGQVPQYSGAIDALKKTVAGEGVVKGLYKGMGAPLATVAVFNAVLFTTRGQMESLLGKEPGKSLSIGNSAVAGLGAGFSAALIACPTELVKCRLQAQSTLQGASSGPPKYTGPMDVAAKVFRHEGGIAGLYRGLTPTFLREVPGNAAMFGSYEIFKRALAGSDDTSNLGKGSLLVAGGLAGAMFWLTVFPFDVVKSVIQIDDVQNPKYKGTVDALRKIYSTEGLPGLYKGFGPAMARSVPANAACFLAYEVAREAMG